MTQQIGGNGRVNCARVDAISRQQNNGAIKCAIALRKIPAFGHAKVLDKKLNAIGILAAQVVQ